MQRHPPAVLAPPLLALLLFASLLPATASADPRPALLSANPRPAPSSPPPTLVVYGATAAGCFAAIAAARTAQPRPLRVVLAAADGHVGGMTTGGLMHADSANTTTIGGITREFFDRVLQHYPPAPAPPPPQSPVYGCRGAPPANARCVELPPGDPSGSPDAKCADKCAPLAEDEWLAVRALSRLSDSNRTLTVTLPPGQQSSYLKKSEWLARHLPADKVRSIRQGQVLSLSRPASVLDATYFLVVLPASVGGPAAVPDLHPGSPGQVGPPWLYESHVAEQVLEAMLAEANVTVLRSLGAPVAVVKSSTSNTHITAVRSESGQLLTGDVWIDGSYEGDLASVAGADMVWGREAAATYNESGAGRQPESLVTHVDPFLPDGSVIPHVSDAPMVAEGEADNRTEAYDFRLCITNSPSHRVPFQRPPSYDPAEFEFWRRLYANGSHAPASLSAAGLGCLGPIPNSYNDCGDEPCTKCDMLGMVHSTDLLNAAWAYPNASLDERRDIRQRHINFTLGLLWFWATDPASGPALHAEMAQLGFCDDEYVDSEPRYFPFQLYVREARRLVGDFVWTENDPPAAQQQRSVGVGAYSFDCHWVSRYAVRRSDGTAYVAAEGRVNNGRGGKPARGVYQAPFPIPYDALLPKRAQLTNLLVPVACSASHVRFNAIRMEPAWGIQGHAAGAAGALALLASHAEEAGTGQLPVQDVDVATLQTVLRAQKQILFP